MTVVGVCAPADAAHAARTHLPKAPHCVAVPGAALAFVDESQRITDAAVRVGTSPTSSCIRVASDELILERGPSWSAPIYYRTDAPFASSHVAPLIRPGDALHLARLAGSVGDALNEDEDRTVYERIKVVRPLETVLLSGRGVSISRRAAPAVEILTKASLDDLADELRRRLFAAIRRAIGERRVGLMLSGGIDSSGVLAAILATRGARATDIQLTLDFDARNSDAPYVRALEAHYGISVVRTRPRESAVKDALIMDGTPSRHPCDPLDFASARTARDLGAELLVTGVGGDQLFGGSQAIAVGAALSGGDLRGAWDSFRASLPYRLPTHQRARNAAVALLRPHLPAALLEFRARKAAGKLGGWIGPLMREERTRALRAHAARATAHDAQERLDEVCLSPFESQYTAELRAQTDVAFGIPRVDPIYDEDLVRFLIGVRPQALFAGASYRGLLRRALRGLLPESVRNRDSKSEFEPAFAEAFAPFDQFEDLLSFERLGQAGIVELGPFQRYLAPLYAAPGDRENGPLWMTFWPAVSAEAFLRLRDGS